MIFVCAMTMAQTNAYPLLPMPQNYKVTDKSFAMGKVKLSTPVLKSEWEAFIVNAGGELADKAAAEIKVELLPVIDGVKLNPDEAYRLSVSGKLIKIEAVTERGVYWALQTLRQLEKKKGKKSLFAGCEIVDWPAFRIRGFMQDVGRSYISVEELKREIEILSRFKINVFHWHLTENQVIAFDHLKQKIFLIVNVKTDNVAINYAKAEREIAAMEEMLLQPVQPKKPVKAKLGEFTSNQSREQYNKSVLRCKEYIKNGDAFQIVYAQKFSATYDQSLFSVYRYLRTTNPSQYMVFLHNDDMEIAGSSPETLVKVVGKKVISMPIAGTRRRGRTSEEDLALEQELLADAKEIAEHNMLVDLGRNDVGRVCDFGSVKVSDYKAIKRFSHVMHITSKVTGQLSADKDALDALRAVFPAGTLSGAPKIRACEIIDELEPERRGIYGGGMGYLDFGGNMDICITIRTMVKKNDRVYIQAGGGIVADSVLDNEFQETVNKAGACMAALCMTAEEE